ncbi:MAG: DUF305 domain-containing protein [Pseudomonadota bacterium]
MKLSAFIPAFAALAIALPAAAQQGQSGAGGSMSGMQMPEMQNMNMDKMSAAQKEFHAAMQKMNQDMMKGMMDSDPGMSWMKQMIAHHQGAIDMSDIVLKNTKDADVIKEARKTKEQNEKDLKELQAKMKNGKKG